MGLHPLAGKPAPRSMLANVPRLISHYYAYRPDPGNRSQQVAFGTSGHRGSSFKHSFCEAHILATTQAICDYIEAHSPVKPQYFFLEANLSGDKKASAQSFLSVRGKKVSAEVTLPAAITVSGS